MSEIPNAQPKTILDVMREPIVSYIVAGDFPQTGAEQQTFENEHEAIEAARMMSAGGATNVTVERRTLRVVEDIESVDWR